MNQYLDYIMEQLENLMAIDSPSGFTEKVTDYLLEEYARLGYSAKRTVKGGVIAEIGGEGDPILTMAHVDTLGAVVAEIKSNGRLVCPQLVALTQTMQKLITAAFTPTTDKFMREPSNWQMLPFM